MSMHDPPLTILITIASLAAGFALAWGVMQATVHQLRELATELKNEVRELRAELSKLHASVKVLEAVNRIEGTGRHAAQNTDD